MQLPKELKNIYGFDGKVFKPIIVDDTSGSLVAIDYAHYEIHRGDSFSVADTVACDTTTAKWQITTQSGPLLAHMVFDLSATGEALYVFTEGSDRTDGTALVEVNRNRSVSSVTATAIITRTPTGGETDGATTLFSTRSGITNIASKNLESGTVRGTSEWVLRPQTKYVVSITTYAASYVTFTVNWYEHPGVADA